MAELQSTNRVKLSKVRESTFGVTPTSPVFKEVRQTSSGLAANPNTVISNEIRSDRQVTDLILTGITAGGPIGGELSFKSVDDDLEEALQGTWSTKPTRDNNGTADSVITAVAASSDTYTVVTGAAFLPNHIVLAEGFGQSANNGVFIAQASTNATAVIAPASPGLADESAPPGAAVLRAVGYQGTSGDLVATTTGGNGLTSTTLDFTTLGLNVGEWIKIGGSAANTFFSGTAANNDWVRLSAISANRLSFDIVPTSWAADTGTGKTLQLYFGDYLINGVTKRSNTFERQYLDHSPVTYEYLTGETLDTLAIEAPAQAIVTVAKTYIGANSTTTTTRASGASDVAAPTKAVMNSSSNVGRIGFDGSAISGANYVMRAAINYANNLRRQNAVGSVASVGTGNGEFSVTGTLESYFSDASVLTKIVNNTLTSFDLRVGRSDGNREKYVFDFPSIKLASGAVTVAGKNQDVMLPATFQAFRDATKGYTASVTRIWYLPN